MSSLTIALAGNPNVGKSTIFNGLTGARQHVGNWPGKTVEKKEGVAQIRGKEIVVVDLPGTYSLTAYSIEEIIARDFIVNERPSVVVSVVDAANLERNLYLVAQLIELNVPVIVALNMSDLAKTRGLKIDPAALSMRLGGIPVIETVGNRGLGLTELKDAIAQVVENPAAAAPVLLDYGRPLEGKIKALEAIITTNTALRKKYNARWLAVKLLENDEGIIEALQAAGQSALLKEAEMVIEELEAVTGEDTETLIADRRYALIGEVIGGVLERPRAAVETQSDKIDRIVTHRIWGVPIFLLLMWVVFQFTANVSAPFLDWVDMLINETIMGWAFSLTGALGLGGTWIEALLTDGIIAGVGAVLVFVPVLMFLYFALAVLEDSGYMARAAFVMDRVMRAIGLHGKSFLPMIVGFGCTVPAVYATRTLENEDDRKLTGFLATFMSCGARLPVYVVFGAAFFGANAGNLTFAMYILGIVIALITGFVMKRVVYQSKPPAPFVMELPPYRVPTARGVFTQMWERSSSFLRKAGTVILAASIVLWLLLAIPLGADAAAPDGRDAGFNNVRAEDSVFGTLSGAIAPVFAPAGFGSWEAAGSLVTGFIAKEVVIGTMGQIYVDEAEAAPTDEAVAAGEEVEEEPGTTFGEDVGNIIVSFGEAAVLTVQETINIIPRTVNIIPGVEMPEADFLGGEEEEDTTELEAALTAAFTASAGSEQAGKLAALAFNVFVLLYVPCMVAVAAMRQEFGARWMWYQIAYTTALAWLAAVIVYQGGKLVGLG
ncbi:MAG: ferrous iron transport protein B [Anaerolineae bacterium]|nr:ferrous iron transport protein B [Anaerolineae bacterium]